MYTIYTLLFKEFHRNGESETTDHHKLPMIVPARYVRFHPTKQYAWNCLRVEIYSDEGLLKLS